MTAMLDLRRFRLLMTFPREIMVGCFYICRRRLTDAEPDAVYEKTVQIFRLPNNIKAGLPPCQGAAVNFILYDGPTEGIKTMRATNDTLMEGLVYK